MVRKPGFQFLFDLIPMSCVSCNPSFAAASRSVAVYICMRISYVCSLHIHLAVFNVLQKGQFAPTGRRTPIPGCPHLLSVET